MQPPVAEELLIHLGQLLSFTVSIFITFKIDRKIGILFVISWLLQNQWLYMNYFNLVPEPTETRGACWARLQDYYECLPLIERVSIHASQFGVVILSVATFMLARKVKLSSENS